MKTFLTLLLISVSLFADTKSGFEYESWKNRPVDKFGQPKEAFEKVKQMLLERYYDKGLTEEAIYRAAVEGMLENLDPKMKEWNQLLSPTEKKEMMSDVAGEIVGSGIEIKFDSDSGLSEVVYVVPDSPAESAGVQAGDRLLSVNGKFYKGMHLRDVVYDIRGKVGEKRKLTFLRKDQVVQKTLHLKRIPYDEVEWSALPGESGLLTIQYFTKNTAEKLTKALVELNAKKIKSLVIDLRGNDGGLFEAACDSAGLFLPKGKTIVKVSRRNSKDDIVTAEQDPIIRGVPIAILINQVTSSGAEIFSAALKENLGATLVGTSTRGKWSVQTVEELPNRYAAKFTVGLMVSPNGNQYSERGLLPDVEVEHDANNVRKLQRITEAKQRIADDTPLRTAINLLKARI